MSLSQSFTIRGYQLHPGGARARLAVFLAIAADSANNRNESTRLQPGDWRNARHYSMGEYAAAYCSGINQGAENWYSHGGEQFRGERDSHEILRGHHRGWFTDSDANETAIGIVAMLPHGRYIAGYRWTSNDERVYFPGVFDDESDAARVADEHARVFAESAREDSERFDAMQNAEIAAEDAAESLRDCWALRRAGRRDSDDVREAIEALRNARETLADATRAYERG